MLKPVFRNRVVPIAMAGASAVALVAWWYVRRWNMDVQETELDVATTQASNSPLQPRDLAGERPIQILKTGQGPIYHRDYQVDIPHPKLNKEALMAQIQQNPNDFTPLEMAYFEKTKGDEQGMHVGDEYLVRIVGPWNGPVRVIDVQPTSFSFITLEGHLEAGEIQFRVLDHPDKEDVLRFEIRSWARSSDTITDFFYRFLGVSKFSQTRMWTYFCKRVAEESNGEAAGKINVMTHKADSGLDGTKTTQPSEKAPAWKQYSHQFDQWSTAKFNFDPSKRQDFNKVNGWHLDDYAIGLPSEKAGPVVPGGPWEAAKQIMLNYEFPDPTLVTGIFMPDNALKDRIMVIRARFMVFTFLFGVRVSQVIDEQRDSGKRGPAQVWGYGYSTLSGHFEMGEITFELWKFLNSGEVEFRIHAYSKTAYISNPFYRIGFRIFGRSLQRRFANTALERMQQLVIQRLAKNTPSEQKLDTPEVQPIQNDQAASDKVAEIGQRPESVADGVSNP